MNKLTCLIIGIGILIVSCDKKIRTIHPIEITPTNKFILFYDKFKNAGHFKSDAGFVFEIKNNTDERIILDSLAILGVGDYVDSIPDVYILDKNNYYIFKDSLIILPGNKQKILIGVETGASRTVEETKKALSVSWIEKAKFVFYKKQGRIKIEKSIKPFYKLPDDEFLYYVDGKLMKNTYVETKYINFKFY